MILTPQSLSGWATVWQVNICRVGFYISYTLVSSLQYEYSYKWNCAALFPIPTFMFRWAIYIFPRLVCLFCYMQENRWTDRGNIHKSQTDTWMWKLGLRPRSFFSGNTYIGFSLQCSCSWSSNNYCIPLIMLAIYFILLSDCCQPVIFGGKSLWYLLEQKARDSVLIESQARWAEWEGVISVLIKFPYPDQDHVVVYLDPDPAFLVKKVYYLRYWETPFLRT